MNKFFLIIKNFDKNKLIVNDINLCLTLSALIVLCFNLFTDLNFSFEHIKFFSYLLEIFLLNLLFLILSFSKKIIKFLAIIILFFSTINFYIYQKYGYFFDEIMIANALDSIGHVNDAIDYKILIYLLFGFIIPSLILLKIKIKSATKKIKLIVVIANLLLILTGLIIEKKIINYTITSVSPSSYINSFYLYYKRFYNAKKTSANRVSLNQFYKFSYHHNIPINVIIVIGESLRADHMEIFGYPRKNNPNLMKIKKLIKFQSKSFFTVTTSAVNDLLSHRLNKEYQDIPVEKSLVDLMKNLGFKTNWFSVQSSKQFGSEMVNVLAMESDNYFFKDKVKKNNIGKGKFDRIFDHDLLPYLNDALNNSLQNLIILHTFGSHIHYFERVPEELIKFRPYCLKDLSQCSQEQIFNAYDNTVLYTDYFLDQVIKIANKSNSILFFISDHGAYLGENGIFANGKSVDQLGNMHTVPMLIYFSDNLLKNKVFKERFVNASKNSNKIINPDYFFDSVLGCIGVESELIDDRKFNLCKNN